MSKLRPCVVTFKNLNNEKKKALFHKWNTHANVVEPSPMIYGAPGGQVMYTTGLVEYEDGTIDEVMPTSIRFTDTDKEC